MRDDRRPAQSRTTRTRHVRRPALEGLEARQLMAVDVSYNELVHDIALDAAGNVYAVGDMYHPIDFDPGAGTSWLVPNPLPDEGSIPEASYLVSYDPSGALRSGWPVQLSHYGADVAVDAAGTVYVTGSYAGEGKISAYGQGGQLTWSAPAARLSDPASGGFWFWGVATDATGLYVSGHLQDDVDADLDGNPATVELSNRRADGPSTFIAKYDLATRAFAWATPITGTVYQYNPPAIAADGQAILVAGYFGHGVQPGSRLLPGTPFEMTSRDLGSYGGNALDSYLLELDPATGQFRRAAHLVDFAAKSVASDGAGVYVGGDAYDNGPADMDPGAGVRLLDHSIVARYRPAADPHAFALDWAAGLGLDHPDRGHSNADIAVANGKVYSTGHILGAPSVTADFDPAPDRTYSLTSLGRFDAYVWALDAATGAFAWARLMGSTERPYSIFDNEYGQTITAGPGGVYTGGEFNWGQADFDRQASYADGRDLRSNDTGVDGFIARYDPDGGFGWVTQLGGVHRTVDDGDAGYSETGTGWKAASANTAGYQRDARVHNKGNGANTARWSFTGLPAGQYEVLTTWRPENKNASDARYTVNGTALPLVNQRLAPDDIRDYLDNSFWERIYTVSVSEGGTVTVVLSDKANGTVVADAVRLVLTAPPAALRATVAAPDPTASTITVAQARPALRQALAYWRARGADISRLRAIDLTIADLGGDRLAEASGRTITLDGDAAGWGWATGRRSTGRMNLRAALVHEVGHLLGHDHGEDGVMAERLAPGESAPSLLELLRRRRAAGRFGHA